MSSFAVFDMQVGMVLSNTAYGTPFPETSPSKGMNHFIQENAERLQAFFARIIEVADLPEVTAALRFADTVSHEPAQIPVCDQLLVHRESHERFLRYPSTTRIQCV